MPSSKVHWWFEELIEKFTMLLELSDDNHD